ncbi:hypothetical protein BH11MYX1_BH11MYX1_08220 [soil metagenome]
MRMLLAASIFAAGSATTAFAQAPGDYSGDASDAPGMVPVQQPVVVASPCTSGRDVMADRWALGLSFGTLGVAPDSAPDATANFDVGELSLRFRMTRHLELEAAAGGGHLTYSDGTQSTTKIQTAALSLRYRFAVERNWNWWVMGGVGVAAMVDDNATQDQTDQASRALGQFGLGLEHRWNHFALQAELKGVAMGETKAERDGTVAYPTYVGRTSSGDTLSGGVFSIGASYYF